MPPSPVQAFAGRPSAAPNPLQSHSALLAALEAIPEHLFRALLLKRLGSTLTDSMVDLLADHEDEFHQGGADVCSTRSIDAHFQQFKARYPAARFGDESTVRAAFARLPWTDPTLDEDGLTFALAFWEGVERWLASANWQQEDGKYVPGALKFLQNDRWREKGQKTIDGRPALGETQRRRLDGERRSRPAILGKLADGVFKPTPAAEVDQRSVEQRYADDIAAGKPRNPAIESYLRGKGISIPAAPTTTAPAQG